MSEQSASDPELVTTVRFLVAGQVQGVGFRWFTQREARRLVLTGWARNLPDGRVEVLAQGGHGPLDHLEKSLKTGPRFSRVESVEKTNDPHDTNTYNSFDII